MVDTSSESQAEKYQQKKEERRERRNENVTERDASRRIKQDNAKNHFQQTMLRFNEAIDRTVGVLAVTPDIAKGLLQDIAGKTEDAIYDINAWGARTNEQAAAKLDQFLGKIVGEAQSAGDKRKADAVDRKVKNKINPRRERVQREQVKLEEKIEKLRAQLELKKSEESSLANQADTAATEAQALREVAKGHQTNSTWFVTMRHRIGNIINPDHTT